MKEDRTKPNSAWKSTDQGGWLMVADENGKIRHEFIPAAKADNGWVDVDELVDYKGNKVR